MLEILQAFLAFAITMLALSTVVTIGLEIVARLCNRRRNVFRRSLELVFEKEVEPLIREKLSGFNLQKAAFVESLQKTPLNIEAQSESRLVGSYHRVMRWLGSERSEEFSTDALLKRISHTELGERIKQMPQAEIDEILQRLGDRFDDLCDAAREYFKNSSQILSAVFGIALALALNIDAYRLLTYFVQNPDVSTSVAAQADIHKEEYLRLQERLRQAQIELETADVAVRAHIRTEIVDIRTGMTGILAKIESLKAAELPIGWTYYPYCYGAPTADCHGWFEDAAAGGTVMTVANAAIWLFWTVATGIMVGIGGPFWYDAVRGATRATQVLRGRAPIANVADARDTAGRGGTRTAVERFSKSARPDPGRQAA